VVIRNPAATLEKLNAFSKKLFPDCECLEMEDFESALNLEPGTLDPAKPVVLAFPQPTFNLASAVIAFVPRDADEFRDVAGRDAKGAAPYSGPERDGVALLRKGVGFVAPNRRAMSRVARSGPPREALVRALDARQEDQLGEGDLFVHLSMARWREEKIAPMFMVAASIAKLHAATAQGGEEGPAAAAAMDYLCHGVRALLDEMESLTLSVRLNNDTISLEHHHTFAEGGEVADYLGQIRYTDVDLMRAIPDVPYLFLFTGNWENTKQGSLSARFCEYVFGLKPVSEKIKDDDRAKLVDAVRACYGQTQGVFMLFGPQEGQLLPMRMFGGYVMKDAAKGLQQFKCINEYAGESLAMMLPGAGKAGKFKTCTKNGVSFEEMSWSCADGATAMRRQLDVIYGPEARLQKTVADKHLLLYSLAQPPSGVCEYLQWRSQGRSIEKNAAVKKLLGQLPSKSQALIICDLGRLLDAMPALVQTSLQTDGTVETAVAATPIAESGPSGPLVGWALTAGPRSLTGRLAMGQADLATFIQRARDLPRSVSTPVIRVQTPAPPHPPSPPRRK
jgi:hypothetical protein